MEKQVKNHESPTAHFADQTVHQGEGGEAHQSRRRRKARSARRRAQPLFQKAGIAEDLDAGVFALKSRDDIGAFLKACGKLRHWDRGAKVGQPRASSDQEKRS